MVFLRGYAEHFWRVAEVSPRVTVAFLPHPRWRWWWLGGGGSPAPQAPFLAGIAFTYNFHFLFLRLINHKGFLSKRRDGWPACRCKGWGREREGQTRRPPSRVKWHLECVRPPTQCFIGKMLKHKYKSPIGPSRSTIEK